MSDAGGSGGGCRCEAARIKVSGEPSEGVIYCHCRDCRRSSGAPVSLFAGYRTEQVEIKRGTPKVYESSSGVSQSFCGDCGTPISYEDERLPGDLPSDRRLRRRGAFRARGTRLGFSEARVVRRSGRIVAVREEQ